MLNALLESKGVFTLKELEKEGKKRGVVVQAVKDVLTELVDDGLVSLEKIGSANYYWSFPSEAMKKLDLRIGSLEESLQQVNSKLAETKKTVATMSKGREETSEHKALMEKYLSLTNQVKEADKELKQFAKNDPEVLKDLERQADSMATERWTDNTYELLSWAVKKGHDKKGAEKASRHHGEL